MIACLGNPVYDTITTPLVRTPGRILSGCSTNAALVLSMLGDSVGIAGCVGEDFREDFDSTMRRRGIETCSLPSRETGGFCLTYDGSGNRELSILGIADPLSTIPPSLLSAELFLFGPILSEIPTSLIDEAREKTDASFFLDPQGYTRRVKGNSVEHCTPTDAPDLVSRFNMVKPNEHEAKLLTGHHGREEPEEACETLYSWGADIAIVTIAEAGSVVYDGSEAFRIPAHETVARDPTGAGDTYAAGFIHAFLQGKPLFECGLFASCVSSYWVEDVGPDIFISPDMVGERVRALRRKAD